MDTEITVMRLGVLLPHRAVVLQSARRPPLEVCWTVARLCDEAGLDLWVGDSVVAKPRLEPLTALASLAALTQRARLGTATARHLQRLSERFKVSADLFLECQNMIEYEA